MSYLFGGIDPNYRIAQGVESRAEKNGTLDGAEIRFALRTPLAEVFFDFRMYNLVYLFEEIAGGEDSRSQPVSPEYVVLVQIAAYEVGQCLSDDRAVIIEPFGSAVRVVYGDTEGRIRLTTDFPLPIPPVIPMVIIAAY